MGERVRSVWDNVDRTADPNWYRNYLDAFDAMETVRAWKQRSFGMLAVAPGQHILDVGCGLGGDALSLAEAVAITGSAASTSTTWPACAPTWANRTAMSRWTPSDQNG